MGKEPLHPQQNQSHSETLNIRKTRRPLNTLGRIPLAGSLIFVALFASQLDGGEPLPKKPNVIVILADDLGWSDLACYGNRLHETPHLDRLAAEGIRFTDAYAAAPLCSPTRACLLTGKSPARLGMTHIIQYHPQANAYWKEPDNVAALPLAEVTLFEALHSAGYATAQIGKWHIGGLDGGAPEGDPLRQGAEVNVAGSEYGQPPDYFFPYTRTVGEQTYRLKHPPPSRDGDFLDEQLTSAAEQFLGEHRDRPFLLCLSFFLPHTSMGNRLQARAEKIAKYQARLGLEKPSERAVYAATIEHLDDCVGRIVKKLDDLGLTEKTLIVFTSDNGGYGEKTSNAPLRDAKSSGYEGGLRVPTIIRMPGHIRRETAFSVPVITADIYPTVLAAAGVRPANPKELDGINLLPLLLEGKTPDRPALFWHYPHFSPRAFSAVRAGRWKLIEFFEESGIRHELYDLVDDRGEQHNLAQQQPEHVRELKARLDEWRGAVGARMPVRLATP